MGVHHDRKPLVSSPHGASHWCCGGRHFPHRKPDTIPCPAFCLPSTALIDASDGSCQFPKSAAQIPEVLCTGDSGIASQVPVERRGSRLALDGGRWPSRGTPSREADEIVHACRARLIRIPLRRSNLLHDGDAMPQVHLIKRPSDGTDCSASRLLERPRHFTETASAHQCVPRGVLESLCDGTFDGTTEKEPVTRLHHARVSSAEQDAALQSRVLEAAGCECIPGPVVAGGSGAVVAVLWSKAAPDDGFPAWRVGRGRMVECDACAVGTLGA